MSATNKRPPFEIRIVNAYEFSWYYDLMISLSLFCALVSCGCWCLYAAGQLNEEAKVYHIHEEIVIEEKGRKSKSRSNAGSDASSVAIDVEEGSKPKPGLRAYFGSVGKSLIPWKG